MRGREPGSSARPAPHIPIRDAAPELPGAQAAADGGVRPAIDMTSFDLERLSGTADFKIETEKPNENIQKIKKEYHHKRPKLLCKLRVKPMKAYV